MPRFAHVTDRDQILTATKDGTITVMDTYNLKVVKTLTADEFQGCQCKPCFRSVFSEDSPYGRDRLTTFYA